MTKGLRVRTGVRTPITRYPVSPEVEIPPPLPAPVTLHGVQRRGVVPYVVFHEGGDEVVAVVVALVPPETEGLAGLGAGLLEDVDAEPLLPGLIALAFQELILRALIYEDGAVVREGALAYQLGRVLSAPRLFVGAEVGGERLPPVRDLRGGADRGECRDAAVEVGVL